MTNQTEWICADCGRPVDGGVDMKEGFLCSSCHRHWQLHQAIAEHEALHHERLHPSPGNPPRKRQENTGVFFSPSQPFGCPVCRGRGMVESGLYDGTTSLMDPCHPCNGTGLVWG